MTDKNKKWKYVTQLVTYCIVQWLKNWRHASGATRLDMTSNPELVLWIEIWSLVSSVAWNLVQSYQATWHINPENTAGQCQNSSPELDPATRQVIPDLKVWFRNPVSSAWMCYGKVKSNLFHWQEINTWWIMSNGTSAQCCGSGSGDSGSACFWASRILIRIHHQQAKK